MKSSLTTSVALCTYQGEHFIEHQLRSILNQTVPVDEVVICDDSSSDATITLVRRIRHESKIPIRIEVNIPKLGVGGNFEKAISLCSGDIIFLSDQDDIWLPEKVETILRWFEAHPDRDVVFSNGYFMDDHEQVFTQRTLFDAVAFTKKTRKYFDMGFQTEAFLSHNRVTGATMALRKSFVHQFTIDKGATIKNERPLHDHVIALAAVSLQKLGYIEKPLIRYRIHTQQECGFGEWIKRPPHSTDLIKPLVPKPEIIGYFLPEARERAQFGKKRKQYRRLYTKWKVVTHRKEYQKHYGKYYHKPLLRDLCWLWIK